MIFQLFFLAELIFIFIQNHLQLLRWFFASSSFQQHFKNSIAFRQKNCVNFRGFCISIFPVSRQEKSILF
ncbi:MAG: hypothetical protein C0412_02195 [Flavobacterium sp.]|nr:hypothetical protein [Flavobacterium sp.]